MRGGDPGRWVMAGETPSAYPLQWPPGWPRTSTRQNGIYRTQLPAALNNLRKELAQLCGERAARTLTLSSNATLGNDHPSDPGVVAYFTWDSLAMAIPCDRWASVHQNVQAIALTIEAMRAMDRHGAKHMIRAMFQGFTALPAPVVVDDWRKVLGRPVSLADAEAAYKRRAMLSHPDQVGGSHAAMSALNAAIELARKELRNA